jgi:hypothetical protein
MKMYGFIELKKSLPDVNRDGALKHKNTDTFLSSLKWSYGVQKNHKFDADCKNVTPV